MAGVLKPPEEPCGFREFESVPELNKNILRLTRTNNALEEKFLKKSAIFWIINKSYVLIAPLLTSNEISISADIGQSMRSSNSWDDSRRSYLLHRIQQLILVFVPAMTYPGEHTGLFSIYK